jgi:hypothetical protein
VWIIAGDDRYIIACDDRYIIAGDDRYIIACDDIHFLSFSGCTEVLEDFLFVMFNKLLP